jgi:dimeric dUTPase (all-alpha-NTP-PPase superfamily)
MKSQLLEMLTMQDAINTQVNEHWRTQKFEWYRAVWVECAELLDHYGWKWWKKQTPDMEQVSLELVDIWHFGLSMILEQSESVEVAANSIINHLDSKSAPNELEFKLLLETFVTQVVSNKNFNFGVFIQMAESVGLTFDNLYIQYVAKNVLNRFRQDHGYKQGTYVKIWQGREDNEHLFEILKQVQTKSDNGLPVNFSSFLYDELTRRYH